MAKITLSTETKLAIAKATGLTFLSRNIERFFDSTQGGVIKALLEFYSTSLDALHELHEVVMPKIQEDVPDINFDNDGKNPVIITTIPDELFIGKQTEIEVTTIPNLAEGIMVYGLLQVTNHNALSIEYYETAGDTRWLPLQLDEQGKCKFGPEDGFPYTNATSKFRVTGNSETECQISISINSKETDEVLASTSVTMNIVNEPKTVTDIDTDTQYDTIAEAIAANATNLKLNKGIVEVIDVPNGKAITIDGNDKTLTGYIKSTPVDGGEETSIAINDLNIVAGDSQTFGVQSQDKTSLNPSKLNVKLVNVTFSGFTHKGLYMTNPGTINFENVAFINCGSDYAIDFNICATQGTVINFDNVNCSGTGATKAMAKITQRGGEDDYAHDIMNGIHKWESDAYVENPGAKTSQIESLTIVGGNWTMDSTDVAICIGSSPNTDSPVEPTEGPRTSTGAFTRNINCNGEAKVRLIYLGEDKYEMK